MYKRGGNWYGNKRKAKRSNDAGGNSAEGSPGPRKKSSSDATDPSQKDETFYPMRTDSVYLNWQYYFYDEDYKKGSATVKKIQAMEAYITSNPALFPISNLENNTSYDVDVKLLYKDVAFMNDWNTFKEDITNNPKHTLNCLSLAIDQVMINAISLTEELNNPKILGKFPKAVARVSNYRPVMPLRDLKVNSYGKLISIRGCIMRAGMIKEFPQWFEFSCKSCNTSKLARQLDGLYTLPTKCTACNGKRFRPILDSIFTKTVSFQTIRLQEHFGDEQDDRGRRPRTIDVELMEHLIGSCMPGDDVTVTGIVKVRGSESNTSKQNSNSNLFSLYMEAVHVLNNKYKSQSKYAAGIDLTSIDHNAIREIYHDPNVFKLLVHSLCPNIYGHELIKAGLLLSLFGGCTKAHNVRDDIHVLVFGDPGLGKSQMMQACTRVASKGVYVCGSSSTSTGLTATLVKDQSSKELVLEPGALVMADKGCCCIDEFDKMPTQHQALLETMEQQSVSLAKSGMVCCLPARTSIIAAANPAGGRYVKSKTIIENLNMSPPLLSRFDLIFVLLDQPNEHLDNLLSEHVMALHGGASARFEDLRSRRANDQLPITGNTLRQKLCLLPTDKIDPIPHRILRDYIFYAKQYVKPTLTPAAVEILQNFYLKCRAKNDIEKITPMTPRQLGALIRLTAARAKLELREQATDNDALEVVAIIEHSMADVTDKPITLNSFKYPTCGKLTANKVKMFISILNDEVTRKGNNTFSLSELKDIVKREKFVIDDFNTMITKLNENGIILKRGNNLYSFSNDA